MQSWFYETIEKSLRIPQYKSISDFFETGFSLTSDDRFSKFNIDYAPWCKVLCDWWDDPSTDWIYLIFASQTSKTSFMMGCLLFAAQYERGAVPVLWVMSNEEEAKTFIKTRLRPFLDEASDEAIKEWKQSAFRVFNSSVKVGYATALSSLRSKPCRFVFGDEIGVWKEPVSYVQKRTRTFLGQRKGVFCTTPPTEVGHHSMNEALTGNFFQWFVPCPHCGLYQGLYFKNLKFEGKRPDGTWDYELVRNSARYECAFCNAFWEEKQKIDIINEGTAVCVDSETYEEIPEKTSDSKTLQVSALYSIFTPWGQLAVDFLEAKAKGFQALQFFFTDELAEVPKGETGESLKQHELAVFIDPKIPRGYVPNYDLYTAACDVMRKGELYWVLLGWIGGPIIAAHVLDYGVLRWLDAFGKPDFAPVQQAFAPFQSKLYLCPIDASDGSISQMIYDFCDMQGRPFIPLNDASQQKEKVSYHHIQINPKTKNRYKLGGLMLMSINSDLVKDEVALALQRRPGDPGAWGFHQETDEGFLRQISNEQRVNEMFRGRVRSVWRPKYSGAPQHYWSALVYAYAAMDEKRHSLLCGGGAKLRLSEIQKQKAYQSNEIQKQKEIEKEKKQKIKLSEIQRARGGWRDKRGYEH